jgi:hypothetical protein
MNNTTPIIQDYPNIFDDRLKLPILIIITLVCFFGNILVVYILTKNEFHCIALFRYLKCLTVYACFSILFLWIEFSQSYFGVNKYFFSCCVFNYFKYIPTVCSQWILTFTNFDRLVSLKCPGKYIFRNNWKFQILIISIITIIVFLLSLPYMFFSKITSAGCFSLTLSLVIIYNTVLSFIFPSILNLFSTCYSYYLLIQKRKKMITDKRKYRRDFQFIKMLIILSVYFFVCNFMYLITSFYYLITTKTFRNGILQNISISILFLYPSFNFLVFLFSSKLFRKYFFSLSYCFKRS